MKRGEFNIGGDAEPFFPRNKNKTKLAAMMLMRNQLIYIYSKGNDDDNQNH